MAHLQQDSESSGYSTSASSEFGSLEERFKFPVPAPRSATKRKAEHTMEELDEMMKDTLVLSPEKRLRVHTSNDANISRETENPFPLKEGRPQTRRSNTNDIELSPRVRALRAPSCGSSIDLIRTVSARCTDSISPKLFKQHDGSPRRRVNLNENGSIYSKHRLGVMFSPLVAGAKRKLATPSQTLRGMNDKHSPMDSPRRGGLRSRGAPRKKILLNERFNLLD